MMYVHECLDDNKLINMTSYNTKCVYEGCISLFYKKCPSSDLDKSIVYMTDDNCINIPQYYFNLLMIFGYVVVIAISCFITSILENRYEQKRQPSVAVPTSLSFSNPLYDVPEKDSSQDHESYDYDDYNYEIDSIGSNKSVVYISDE